MSTPTHDPNGLPPMDECRAMSGELTRAQIEAVGPTHIPCCSSHGIAMSCDRYRLTHFVEVRPCCAADADLLRAEGVDPNGPWQSRISPHAQARAALTAAAQVQPECAHTYIVQEDGWRECSKCSHRYQRYDPAQPAPEADEREALIAAVEGAPSIAAGFVADSILAAGFRRSQPAPRTDDALQDALIDAIDRALHDAEEALKPAVGPITAAVLDVLARHQPAPRTVSAESVQQVNALLVSAGVRKRDIALTTERVMKAFDLWAER